MSSLPLVNVTARITDQGGRPIAGAVVRMRLCAPEKYQGLIVPRETSQVTDAAGLAVLRVFPNALGYEGSEYDVHVSFPASGAGVCGCTDSLPVLRPIRAHAVVPNSDCNLFDILNLPPYEQRGAGSVLPEEVAGYAAAAANSAEAARSSAAAAAGSTAAVEAAAKAAKAAQTAAEGFEEEAEQHVHRVRDLVSEVDARICEWTNTGTEQVEKVTQRLLTDARQCIAQDKADALNAIEQRAGEALAEATERLTAARTEAVLAVNEAGATAVHAVEDARDNARDELNEMAGQFEEDFEMLAERAEAAAKRAGCASAAAANSAARACECATRAETAAKDAVQARNEAADAARRAETAAQCVKSDAQRAEAAADSAGKSADHAEGSALAAQKAAAAADASAKDANLAAEQAVAAQQAAAADRDYVAGVAADVEQAVRDVAVDMLTPQVVSEAIDKATAEAQAHAQAAADSAAAAEATLKETKDSATEAARQANLAKTRADRAESAAQAAEDAARAADCAASRATQKAEDIMAHMADGVTVAWTSDEAIPQGELLPLPQNCGYYPGHHAVSLSWDGLVCHVGRQFEEVGEPGLLSHAVRLLFAAPALSDWQARICAHADAPAAGDEASILEERLAAIERNLSRLDREAVRFTADDTAAP